MTQSIKPPRHNELQARFRLTHALCRFILSRMQVPMAPVTHEKRGMNLDDPKLYTNREISWLRFNERVLEEARDPNNPLLERVKFLAIVANNLDEFFEIRVAGLLQQMEAGVHDAGPDGLLPEEVFETVSIETHRMVHEQYACWNEELLPALKKAEVHIRSSQDLEPAEQEFIRDYWLRELHPVLTPLTVNPAHPIPRVVNKSLCLAVFAQGQ